MNETNDLDAEQPTNGQAVEVSVDESMPMPSQEVTTKGVLVTLSSLDTADESTTEDGSRPTTPGTWAEAPTFDESPPSLPPGQSRRPRLFIACGVALLVLVTIVAALGATGRFQHASNRYAATSASTGDEDIDMEGANPTTETGVDVNPHDTEQPDVLIPTAWPATENEGDDNDVTATEEPDESWKPATPATLRPPPVTDNDADDESSRPALSASLRPVTYVPGLLTVEENGLLLSQGLISRQIAERRRPVEYANGELSSVDFHRRPDYGACFPVPPEETENQGGWVYVSNSELKGPPTGLGGVGAIVFDRNGNVIHYQRLLENTTRNCAGGRTPWNSFISCEEVEDVGQVYQVDPWNRRPPERITMGMLGGRYESFAFDDRDKSAPRFFVTEDLSNGPTVRWTPDADAIDWDHPWEILTGNGTMEYLLLTPNTTTDDSTTIGTFEWTRDLSAARENASRYARGTEGIDCNGRFLYFVCKTDRLFYILDLDNGTYVMRPANIGLFDGEPDQVKRIVNDTQDILYFTEAGSGAASGIHGRNSKGQYVTILEGVGFAGEETTGLAFSPNGLHMYVAFQDPGVIFDITRTDGYPFHGLSLDVRYHNPPLDHMLRP